MTDPAVTYDPDTDVVMVRQPPLHLPLTRDEAIRLANALTDAVDEAERVR